MRSTLLSPKTLVPFGIVGIIAIIIFVLVWSKPEAKKRKPPSGPSIAVETIQVQPQLFTPNILSYGLVEPRIKSNLVAQVTGRIVTLSERFRDGGFFKEDDLLLKIDPTDYEIEVDIAAANLAQAERALEEEKAQARQAREDWERLGEAGQPSPLVLREPQLKAALANVNSVKAQLRRAEINLARTEIRAPYDGRVLTTNIGLGQVVSNNGVLGEIYATDAIEVRLPIKNDEIPLLDLPETYRNQDQTQDDLPTVNIISDLANKEVWQGKIVRTASSIDDDSRQLYVVARIDDPFGKKAEGRFPLKIGQYVTAEIKGRPLASVINIPNRAIYQGTYVYTYFEGAAYRNPIDIKWQNGELAVLDSGLAPGDQLVVSPLGQIASGTPVRRTDGSKFTAEAQRAAPSSARATKESELEDWLASLPPQRLERLKARASREGKSFEELAKEVHARRQAPPKEFGADK